MLYLLHYLMYSDEFFDIRFFFLKIKNVLGFLFLLFFISGCARIERLNFAMSLFSGKEQYQNFHRIDEILPIKRLSPSDSPLIFDRAQSIKLPSSFSFNNQKIETEDFLFRTDTSALLIIKGGKIVYENYWLTGGKDKKWISFSMAKSFISALIGIANNQGYIKDVKDPITDYVPKLKGSAYDNVRIKDILQMSSGASWNEDYSDNFSDINRVGRIFAIGGSLDKIAMGLRNDKTPGTYNSYNSIDTQVLGMLLRESTNKSITEFMIEVLWNPIGAEHDGFWVVDSNNMELAFGGFNATARDYAKLGELYRQGGKLNGNQIVPAKWVKDSITPDAPHLMPGNQPQSGNDRGYGYQWWLPDLESGDFMAIGVYNQFIYVAPQAEKVIVKLSANSLFGTSAEANAKSVAESISFFKSVTMDK